MHSGDNMTLADESVYEIPQEYNYSSDRPAYIGRPSTGGNGQAPCVACGQDRIQVHFIMVGLTITICVVMFLLL